MNVVLDIEAVTEGMTRQVEEMGAMALDPMHIAQFERAIGGSGNLGGGLLSEIGQIKEQFTQAKRELEVRLATPSDSPASLMQMQWSLMRITMQEELLAKTVGRMSQSVETLLKTQ